MEREPLSLLLWLGLCISGLQAQGYVPVESREGETLSVQCPYNQQYRENLKGWRRGEIDLLVSTRYTSLRAYQNKVTVGRTTIQDDTDKGIVTITMKMLQVQDAGVYTCTVYVHNRWYPLKIIDLRVSQRVQEHKAVEGQKLTVRCLYSARDYGGEEKAWCRYMDEGYCSILVSTYSSYESYPYRDLAKRTTIRDNAQNGTVTITVDKLQADDSGVYWCALYASPHLYRLLEVRLAVSKGLTTENIPTTPPHTGPVLKSSTPDSRNNREPQKNSEVSFSISSWLVLLLALLTTKTLMAVTIALLVRRRLHREEAPEPNLQP